MEPCQHRVQAVEGNRVLQAPVIHVKDEASDVLGEAFHPVFASVDEHPVRVEPDGTGPGADDPVGEVGEAGEGVGAVVDINLAVDPVGRGP